MSLVLSSNDCARLQKALDVITAPLDAPSLSQWRFDVLATLAPLFDADAGAFVLAGNDEPACSLLNRPQQYVEDYTKVQFLDTPLVYQEQQRGVSCTLALSNGDRRAFQKLPIYDLFFHKYNVEESIFTGFGITESPPYVAPGMAFIPGGVPLQASFNLYADRVGRERMGPAGLPLFALVRPILQAAAQVWLDVGRRRAELRSLIDAAPAPTILCDSTGKVLHRNPAASAIAAGDGSYTTAEIRATHMARALAAWRSRTRTAGSAIAPETNCVFDSRGQRYDIRASWVDALSDQRPAVVVTILPLRMPLPGVAEVRRLGLTAREAEVAILLARGNSTKEIAKALGVTVFTVRRHTEKVFAKLGVNSRSMVASRLLSPHGH